MAEKDVMVTVLIRSEGGEWLTYYQRGVAQVTHFPVVGWTDPFNVALNELDHTLIKLPNNRPDPDADEEECNETTPTKE